VSSVPNVLVVHSSQAVRTLGELLVFTRSRPGQLNYASAGSGISPSTCRWNCCATWLASTSCMFPTREAVRQCSK